MAEIDFKKWTRFIVFEFNFKTKMMLSKEDRNLEIIKMHNSDTLLQLDLFIDNIKYSHFNEWFFMFDN
jgi:hypothetical protein